VAAWAQTCSPETSLRYPRLWGRPCSPPHPCSSGPGTSTFLDTAINYIFFFKYTVQYVHFCCLFFSHYSPSHPPPPRSALTQRSKDKTHNVSGDSDDGQKDFLSLLTQRIERMGSLKYVCPLVRVCPSARTKAGGAHSPSGEGVECPNSNVWRKSLVLCLHTSLLVFILSV
jgi:hypothetical protein